MTDDRQGPLSRLITPAPDCNPTKKKKMSKYKGIEERSTKYESDFDFRW